MKKLNRQHPDDYFSSYTHLYSSLRAKIDDDKLTAIFVSLRKDPQLEGLIKGIQQKQYLHWLDEGLSPDYLKSMLKVDGKTAAELKNDKAADVWQEYAVVWLHNYKLGDR